LAFAASGDNVRMSLTSWRTTDAEKFAGNISPRHTRNRKRYGLNKAIDDHLHVVLDLLQMAHAANAIRRGIELS
jgi:hypothetical protein